MFPEQMTLSPNRDDHRTHERLGVLFHHTEVSAADAIRRMADPAYERSYHCIIRTDGARITLVPDEAIAWHAGASVFRGRRRCNDFLLGVGFEGDTAAAPLTVEQIASALEWLAARWRRYHWSLPWMTDHRQVSPSRKRDLDPAQWERLRAAIAEKSRAWEGTG
jgi:AmpD protein